ncbi:hypothetical protein ONS95_008137 [Cadophora gregata]|uniref:uncharacterized protein n=1 Tax=Cadophora gregata TaxID=51156 RepID=UPI0026DD7345|nr:uncharacterized protein ONS95_008137 [Cadophora gregata]KAK0119290.1 hypothetical protein ONS96_012348 [Cadophora gregata f. sp. sojae]KAK0126544.1 hypothetical protein ONS95_008137 [Cadophora gregata]
MVRTFTALILLALFSSFNSNIYTFAVPSPASAHQALSPLLSRTPNYPSSQHALQPSGPPNPEQKLCGFPLLWLYPCTWTSDPSISQLQKLGPVIFAKYIINIPGALLDSFFTPRAIIERREHSNINKYGRRETRSVEQEEDWNDDPSAEVLSKVKALERGGRPVFIGAMGALSGSSSSLRVPRLILGPYAVLKAISSIPKSLSATIPKHIPRFSVGLTRRTSNTNQLDDLAGQTAVPGDKVSKQFYCWFAGFLYPCDWAIKMPDPEYEKHCHIDATPKLPGFPTKTCDWTLKSAAHLSKTIPRIFTLPAMFVKAVKAIPLSRPTTINRYQHRALLAPLELDGLNSKTTIQEQKTSKALCWWFVWGYHCSGKPEKSDTPTYQQCRADEPSKSEHEQTWTCFDAPSAAHASRSVPRIFTFPVMLLRAVHAIPVSRSTPNLISRWKRVAVPAAPAELENLNGTAATQETKVSKELKQCWVGIFLWPCWNSPPPPPPQPKKQCQMDMYTAHVTCVEVPSSAARSTLIVPRLFSFPILAVKKVSATSNGLIAKLRSSTKSTGGNDTMEKRKKCSDNERHKPGCEISFHSSSTSLAPPRIFKPPFILLSLLPKTTLASPLKKCSGAERQHPDCEHSFPSSSTNLSPPRIFKLPVLALSSLLQAANAIPFPRPAAITNSIADPNFNLVRKSVGEMMDGVGMWLGRRQGVDLAKYGVDWNKASCTREHYLSDAIMCNKDPKAPLDSAGSRAGGCKIEMAALGVLGVAVVFAGFL